MIAIITILIIVFISDQFINRKLIKKLNIEETDLDKQYVNKLHKFGEIILSGTSIILMIILVTDFPHLRILIFVGMVAVFSFRTIMQWIFTKEDKTYILSAITCVLLIFGLVTYGTTNHFNLI